MILREVHAVSNQGGTGRETVYVGVYGIHVAICAEYRAG